MESSRTHARYKVLQALPEAPSGPVKGCTLGGKVLRRGVWIGKGVLVNCDCLAGLHSIWIGSVNRTDEIFPKQNPRSQCVRGLVFEYELMKIYGWLFCCHAVAARKDNKAYDAGTKKEEGGGFRCGNGAPRSCCRFYIQYVEGIEVLINSISRWL